MLTSFKERNPWAAVTISLLLGPVIAMCYLNRGRLALVYLAILLTLCVTVLLGIIHIQIRPDINYIMSELDNVSTLCFPVAIAGAIHSYLIAKKYKILGPAKWYAHWYSLIGFFIVPIIFAFAFRAFLYEPFHIPNSSMSPNVNPGDYLFVKKFSYYNSLPQRGDIVVFKLPKSPHIHYIKRIIGLPGDSVQLKEDVLYINNQAVARRQVEDYVIPHAAHIATAHQFIETLPEGKEYRTLIIPGTYAGQNTPVYKVPPDNYFMLGDNRDNSNDSRFPDIGFIPLANITGKPVKDFP